MRTTEEYIWEVRTLPKDSLATYAYTLVGS
jgi:hypothetical protein